ncbi:MULTISPECIES: FHA domain-containing protein [unclassified Adlercreutzia]|uniref:FHA domain-containing protein n=1 Tax=unclassified Adlercreutzia TaxID=2636013 RepID=UPI0013EA6F79|nr:MULTISPECIES: FHA domain-containing protein [unclassified Adlercreutzia]
MSDKCPVCQSQITPRDNTCRVCGFNLIGKTSRFQPVPSQPLEANNNERTGRASLRTIRGLQVGVSYTLSQSLTSIGRDPKCTIFLNDMTVSRAHATITREDDCYVIRDNGSFNGVWVNNMNVEAKTLQDGDVIQIGSFAFVFEN